MEITKELIETIHERAREYCLAKNDVDPDYIKIMEDGTIEAIDISYWSGDREEAEYYINAEDLTEDLDKIAKEREEKRLKDVDIAKVKREKQKKQREEIDKINRKAEYLRLKKEFE
mgnify:CR=1 FL=1